ncbi:MAG TPA: response regulator [Gemmatimonadales bacterium]|nr:response regulator [Gemmatimonadales bacterium]
MGTPLRVLLVEDSADDARLLVRQLGTAGYDVTHRRVDTPDAMQEALERNVWDIVISDYSMPQFSGTAALNLVKDRGLDVPFIFVSGTIGEDVAVAAMKAGASDYVLKDKLKRLVPAIERELRDAEVRRERRRAQEVVLERTRLAVLSSDLGVALTGVAALRATLVRCTGALVRHLDVIGACIWTFSESARGLELAAGTGLSAALADAYAKVSLDDPLIGNIVRQRRPVHMTAGETLPIPDAAWVERNRIATFAGCPLLVGERTVGVLGVFSRRTLPSFVVESLSAIADQLAVGIERRRAEEELRQSEERFSRVFRSSPVGIVITTLDDGRYLDANDAFLTLLGRTRDQVQGKTTIELGVWRDAAERTRMVEALGTHGTVRDLDLEFRTASGAPRSVLASIERIELSGRPCLLMLAYDISDRKRLEDQLRQAQKMEAIGRLAGGLAHDFNNLLGVVIGYCDLLFRKLPPDLPERAEILEIRQAAEGASGLTRQLLAFSRRQVLEPRVLDLNGIVRRAERMLKPLLGDDVALVIQLGSDIPMVLADSGQIDQVLMNLAVNSRDAMPRGGTITIETATVRFDETSVPALPGARPGEFATLAVTDTGTGMDAETIAHIFEPFFTTKDVGKGTGLGLATVYGIVQQSSGFISVSSKPEVGTTFRIHLPETMAAMPEHQQAAATASTPHGGGTILVVEDSSQLRELFRDVLELHGYKVLDAPNGRAAVEVAADYPATIDLLLTDVIMPEMNGRQLADRLLTTRPGIKVMFASGYSADDLVRHGVEAGMAYMQKPFSPESLAQKVKDVLG